MPSPLKDYYKILGVHRSVETHQIKARYRKLAREHHPDYSKSPDATRRMQEINEAYDVLSDPVQRARYDRRRASRFGAWSSDGAPIVRRATRVILRRTVAMVVRLMYRQSGQRSV